MPASPEPSNPRDAYTSIIDTLVHDTSTSVHEALLRNEGIYARGTTLTSENEFVIPLTAPQRGLLADMLHKERISAIHDTLAVLSWWMQCREVGVTFRGKAMPVALSGMGLHGDYIGRLDGWPWPDEAGAKRRLP